MARLLQQIIEEPRACSYLPDRCASLQHRIMLDLSAEELEPMLARGWRRFGLYTWDQGPGLPGDWN